VAARELEEWRPVVGYANYEVSDHGRVRRVQMVVRKTLTPPTIIRSRADKNGRPIVAFRVGTRQKRFRVNVLVFRAFVGELPGKFQIDHLDGDFQNCRPTNLRIADRYIAGEDDMRWCGKTFGYWTVLRRAGKDRYGNAKWLCRCTCGTEKPVLVGDLRRGMSRNCGCKTGELQNLKGQRNPAWRGGRSRNPETPGTYAWCQARLNGINYHAKNKGYAKVSATVEQLMAMWKDARGVCAACGRPPRDKKTLHLDHDHSTGRPRGFLCNHCNVSIGMIGDSANLLRRLADYIDSH
jgi:hypothetical protein